MEKIFQPRFRNICINFSVENLSKNSKVEILNIFSKKKFEKIFQTNCKKILLIIYKFPNTFMKLKNFLGAHFSNEKKISSPEI